jgi:hypothetical protein
MNGESAPFTVFGKALREFAPEDATTEGRTSWPLHIRILASVLFAHLLPAADAGW